MPIAAGSDWATQLRDSFAQIDVMSASNLAAFIADPILITGGAACRLSASSENPLRGAGGMLLILDDAQTGLGRAGLMFVF